MMELIAAPASVVLLSALSEFSISTPAAHEVTGDSLEVKILMLEFLDKATCNS